MAVVVDRVIGGIRDDGAIAQPQGKKHLCRGLPPHLQVPPDFQLDAYFEGGKNKKRRGFKTQHTLVRQRRDLKKLVLTLG